MTALRRQMDNDMVVRGMAAKTREAYLAAVVGLVRFYRRRPEQISDAEVQTYLLHLIQERDIIIMVAVFKPDRDICL